MAGTGDPPLSRLANAGSVLAAVNDPDPQAKRGHNSPARPRQFDLMRLATPPLGGRRKFDKALSLIVDDHR
jgi:hypothetical protein